MKLFLLVLVLLCGCASPPVKEIVTVPVEVKVPVSVPCKVEWPTPPQSNVGLAPIEGGLRTKGVAIIKELEETRAYARLLAAALKACSESSTVQP